MQLRKMIKKIKQNGIATLLSVSALIGITSSTLIYTSKSSQLEQASYTATQSSNQAFAAAEAGLEHGLAYLNSVRTTIDSDNDQNINVTVQDETTSLSDGSSYSFKLENINAGSMDLIKVTATGSSGDLRQSKTISQVVSYLPMLKTHYIPTVPLTVKGVLEVNGSPDIYNTNHTQAAWVGGILDINGSMKTYTQSGMKSITKNTIDPSVKTADTNLGNSPADNMMINYFGMPLAEIQAYIQASHMSLQSGDSVTSYNDEIIWYEGDLSFSGGEVVGSPGAPVILIVNGNLSLGGNITFYGFLFVRDDFDAASGNITIHGAAVCNGNMTINGTSQFYYDQDILNHIGTTFGHYTKVAGSWKDY